MHARWRPRVSAAVTPCYPWGMQLFYSRNSPYARIARIAVRESGLADRVEERLAANRQPDNPVLAHSPVGRVPALIDGGLVITEARNVFTYLAESSGHPAMGTTDRPDWPAIMREGQIVGFVDGIAAWVRENRRPPERRSSFLLQVEADRSRRCLAWLEEQAAAGHLDPFPRFAAVALAVGLDLMRFHGFHPEWLDRYPALARWFEAQEVRPSMRQTAPVEGDSPLR